MINNKPKILRIITRLNIGGPAIQAITLANSMPNHLLVYGSLDTDEGDMLNFLKLKNDNYIYLPELQRPIKLIADIKAFIKIIKIIIKFQPDIIHTHTAKAGLVGRSAAIFARIIINKKYKIIHTYHGHVFSGYFGNVKTKLFIYLEKLLSLFSHSIITISNQLQSELVHTYKITNKKKCHIIPLGFNLERFLNADKNAIRKEFNIKPSTKICINVGRLVPIKNQKFLIEAFAKLLKKQPDTCLLIVGDGTLKHQLKQQVNSLNITQKIIFCGWRQDMPNLYASASLNLLTSINEGTPVAIIEAGATATPSLSTDVGGIKDVITNNQTGFLIEANSSTQIFADKINHLLNNISQCSKVGINAKNKVLQEYSFNKLTENLINLYKK